MGTYIMLTSLTADGSRSLYDNPDRPLEVNDEIEEYGCSVVSQYATMGPYDFVTVIDAPDNDTALRLSARLGARGTMSILTMPASSVADFVGALKAQKGQSRRAV